MEVIKIKQYFYKSPFLILIYTTVTALIIISFSSIINQFFNFNKTLTFLSDDYVIAKISNHNTDSTALNREKLVKSLEKIKSGFVFVRDYSTTNSEEIFYDDGSLFNIKMISGRKFSQHDFTDLTNTAIVAKNYISKCKHEGNNLILIHDNKEFEVIGIFDNSSDSTQFKINYYVNYKSANLLTEPSDGTYYFDSKNSSLIEFKKVLNNINDIGSKPVIEYTQAKTDSKSLLNVVSNSKSIIATVLLTMLLVLLNVFSSTYNWINGRRKEISIRKMVGATDREISRYIIKGYLLLVTISFIIGFIGSVIFIKVYHPPLTGETVSPWVIVFNYIFVNVIGLMIITASLNSYYRKQIIQVLR